MASRAEVTELLQQWGEGRQDALDRLLPEVYSELRREETAEVLRISPATVGRDWTLAKAWLHAGLKGPHA